MRALVEISADLTAPFLLSTLPHFEAVADLPADMPPNHVPRVRAGNGGEKGPPLCAGGTRLGSQKLQNLAISKERPTRGGDVGSPQIAMGGANPAGLGRSLTLFRGGEAISGGQCCQSVELDAEWEPQNGARLSSRWIALRRVLRSVVARVWCVSEAT